MCGVQRRERRIGKSNHTGRLSSNPHLSHQRVNQPQSQQSDKTLVVKPDKVRIHSCVQTEKAMHGPFSVWGYKLLSFFFEKLRTLHQEAGCCRRVVDSPVHSGYGTPQCLFASSVCICIREVSDNDHFFVHPKTKDKRQSRQKLYSLCTPRTPLVLCRGQVNTTFCCWSQGACASSGWLASYVGQSEVPALIAIPPLFF